MEKSVVSLREIEDAHRLERAEDASALRTGKTSVRRLQERNSFLPAHATMQIVDLGGYLKARRKRK